MRLDSCAAISCAVSRVPPLRRYSVMPLPRQLCGLVVVDRPAAFERRLGFEVGFEGSRDRHLNSAEVSMIQYFTFSSNRGTDTLTLAARTAVSHRALLIDSAGAQKGRPP